MVLTKGAKKSAATLTALIAGLVMVGCSKDKGDQNQGAGGGAVAQQSVAQTTTTVTQESRTGTNTFDLFAGSHSFRFYKANETDRQLTVEASFQLFSEIAYNDTGAEEVLTFAQAVERDQVDVVSFRGRLNASGRVEGVPFEFGRQNDELWTGRYNMAIQCVTATDCSSATVVLTKESGLLAGRSEIIIKTIDQGLSCRSEINRSRLPLPEGDIGEERTTIRQIANFLSETPSYLSAVVYQSMNVIGSGKLYHTIRMTNDSEDAQNMIGLADFGQEIHLTGFTNANGDDARTHQVSVARVIDTSPDAPVVAGRQLELLSNKHEATMPSMVVSGSLVRLPNLSYGGSIDFNFNPRLELKLISCSATRSQ